MRSMSFYKNQRPRASVAVVVACCTLFVLETEAVDIRFEDVTKSSGINFVHKPPIFDKKLAHIMDMVSAGASGGSVADFNNDGLLDIFMNNPRIGEESALYTNKGNMTFSDVTHKMGLGGLSTGDQAATTGLFMDYDGDGWKDLLIVRFGRTLLYRNIEGKRFEDVTDKSGIKEHANALTAVSFDYDKDGDLDIYLGSYFRDMNMFNLGPNDKEVLHDSWETSRNGGSNLFYVNNGDGTFSEATNKVGLSDTGWTMALAHFDYDNDGWQDIYVANDYGTDKLFRNSGKGDFEDVSLKAIGADTKKGMNAEVSDFDNDGDLDIYVTNVTEKFLYECNMLWQNSGKGEFVDVSVELGACDTGWGWAGKFMDFDNDSWLDLYVANGFFTGKKGGDYLDLLLPAIWESGENPSDPAAWPPLNGMGMAASETNVAFRNVKGRFERVSKSGLDLSMDSRAILTGDFDNDGLVDAVVTNNDGPTKLLQNRSKGGNWLSVDLVGNTPNTDAVGARLYLKAGGHSYMREVNIGNGFAGSSSLRQHFGLGATESVEELVVVWPNGSKQSYKDIKTNQRLVFAQANDGASNSQETK